MKISKIQEMANWPAYDGQDEDLERVLNARLARIRHELLVGQLMLLEVQTRMADNLIALKKCGEPIERPWRDEDIAMCEPSLRGIDTCQRTPGHSTNHSARTDAQLDEVIAQVDAMTAQRNRNR